MTEQDEPRQPQSELPKPDRWTDYLAWKQSQRERPLPKTHGLWCPECHVSHPYNAKGKLMTSYEQHNGVWTLLWLCPRTKNVVGEIRLGQQPKEE